MVVTTILELLANNHRPCTHQTGNDGSVERVQLSSAIERNRTHRQKNVVHSTSIECSVLELLIFVKMVLKINNKFLGARVTSVYPATRIAALTGKAVIFQKISRQWESYVQIHS